METRSAIKSRCSAPTSGRTNGRACVNCHQRKIRCDVLDRGTPCTNCRLHDRAGCKVYEKKKFRASGAQTPVPIRPREQTPVTLAPAPAGPASDAEDNETGNLCDLIDREDLRTAEIGYGGRMCFIGSEISNFNYLVRQSSLHPGDDTVFHFGNRQFHPKYTSHDLHIPSESLERAEPEVERKLLRTYFDHINRGWPIVDEECFMVQYSGKDPRIPLSLPLLNAILLVGAHVLAPEDRSMKKLQAAFFRRAKTLIDCRLDQDRTVYVQVALLMTWYSDGLEEIVANGWHWIGVATRTALGCGMDRDVTQSKIVPVAKRTWTRLWWVLFQFDTMVSASYGRPQTLCLDESDVPELEQCHFEGIPRAEVDFIIQHCRLCAIVSRAMKARWALRATTESRIQATRRADEALAHFTLQLPPGLQVSTPSVNTWQATLHLTFNNFLILLHRPAPKHSSRDEVSEACSDLTICGGAATAISSILETLLHRGSLSTLWLYGVHALFTAMIHTGNEFGSPNPLVSAKAQRTFDSLTAALRVLSQQWRFALGLLRLFEQRASRISRPSTNPSANHSPGDYEMPQRPLDRGRNDDTDFALRPTAADASISQPGPFLDPTWDGGNGQEPLMGVNGRVDDVFLPDFSFPDASALEFFLADMNGSNQDFGLSVSHWTDENS